MNDTRTSTARALELRRTFNAPRERVFAAWTKPELIRQFLAPGEVRIAELQLDVRTGGSYRITMIQPDGERYVAFGTYKEIREPELLRMTWTWEEDDPADEQETLLTVEFLERGNATELVLTHERFRDDAQRDRHEHGWTMVLDKQQHIFERSFSIVGLDLSGYMVKDAPRAIAFYRDVLGLEPSRFYPEDRGAEYDLPDGTTFGLWGGGKVMPFQPSNGILFAVDDLDAATASLKARGIPIIMETGTPNCRMAAINDTEGNTIFLHKRESSTGK
jgi:uncharacterized protein YndB with AHSA1/START domain/predicted enzyme related to lactoylglutathione lyase